MSKDEVEGYDKMIEDLSKDLSNFPKEFKDENGELKKVDIICNECCKKSLQVSLNPIGLKC